MIRQGGVRELKHQVHDGHMQRQTARKSHAAHANATCALLPLYYTNVCIYYLSSVTVRMNPFLLHLQGDTYTAQHTDANRFNFICTQLESSVSLCIIFKKMNSTSLSFLHGQMQAINQSMSSALCESPTSASSGATRCQRGTGEKRQDDCRRANLV